VGIVELSVLERCRGGGKPQGLLAFFYFCIFWSGSSVLKPPLQRSNPL